MKKLCIFDLDGTLTDTITAIAHFGNTALREAMGVGPIDKERYKKLVGDGRDKLIHRMLDCFGLDTEENFEKTRRVYDFYYEADPMYKTDAYEGIRQMLARLGELGIKTAVCSNKPDNVVGDVVHTIFGGGFDFVAGALPELPTKPAPDGAIRIMEKLGVSREDTVFIGDTNVDIFTAKNAGVDSIGVLWGFRDRAELESAGADYIISEPSDIVKIVTAEWRLI
ncbi:MAG: HAD family hydrolase [Clostridiales bacterium]|nr:HAD family hydrolase [Clostridiales bacterium]